MVVRTGRSTRNTWPSPRDWQIRPYLEEELARIGRIPERQD